MAGDEIKPNLPNDQVTPPPVAVPGKKESADESKVPSTNSPVRQIEPCPNDRRAEYAEVNSNIRHYSSLRFAIITVFFAATGGVASVAFNIFQADEAAMLKLAGRIAGLLITALFLQYEWLVGSVLAHNRKVGTALEIKMGLTQISKRSTKRVAIAHWFARVLYAVFLIFWSYMIWRATRPLPIECDDCI
jgi:hypothetical protein